MSRRRARGKSAGPDQFTDSWLFKFSTKLMLGLVVVVVFLTLTQCTVKKPEAPTWTTQVTVPLVNRTYAMPEIIDKIDQEGIELTDDSAVVYSFSRDIDTLTLDNDELSTSDVSYSVSEVLGLVTISAPPDDSQAVALDDIADVAIFVPGAVPAMSFDVDNAMQPISTFATATVSSGGVWAVVSNQLGFDLSAVTIQLYDVINMQIVDSRAFVGGIANGVTDSVQFDLTNRSVSNQFEIRMSATTPGGTVLTASDKEIRTAMRFDSDLTVSAATAEIPPLNRSFTQNVDLGESDPVYEAQLSNGQLTLNILNQTNLPAVIEISFPDLYQGASHLSVQRSVAANSGDFVSLNLDGYDLRPADSSVPQSLRIDVDASSVGSQPGQFISVNQLDGFSVDAALSNLEFSSVTGVFSSVGTTIEPRTEEIELENGFDQLELVDAVLTISIENGVDLAGVLDLNLVADNGNVLNIAGQIDRGSAASPVISLIVDSTVAAFLSPIPTSIVISGDATFGDGVTPSTITQNDYLFASLSIVAPLEVRITDATIETEAEAEEFDLGDVVDHVVEARFVYNIVNHLPIGAQFNLYFGSDSATVFDSPELLIDEIAVPAAPVFGGIVTDTISTGYLQVVLDSAEIRVFERDSVYVGTRLVLEDTPPGETARLTVSDYISITGRIEVEYLFDGEF